MRPRAEFILVATVGTLLAYCGLSSRDSAKAMMNMNPVPVQRIIHVVPFPCGPLHEPVTLNVGSQHIYPIMPGECIAVRDLYWFLARATITCADGRTSGEIELLGPLDPVPVCVVRVP